MILDLLVGLLRCAKEVPGDGRDPAGVEIQIGRVFVELHLQCVDKVLEANGRGHGFVPFILTRFAPPHLV